MITTPPKFPMYKVKTDASWSGRTILNRNKFLNFAQTTSEGKLNSVFGSSEYGMDYIPIIESFDTEFNNVEAGAVCKLKDPNPRWAIIKDCGFFPCTGPKNVLYSFKNTKWLGKFPENAQATFQIIHDNEGFAPFIKECEKRVDWNAYYCLTDKMGILQFESNDWDAKDRALQPIFIREPGVSKMNNTLNAYMDHIWDGFYTGQIRMARFPSITYATKGKIYDMVYSGNTPKNQTFRLRSQNPQNQMQLRIHYPDTGSFSILVNGVVIESNQWDDRTKGYKPIKGLKCGENRFIGIKNILEFYITNGCMLEIKPRDAIQTMVRMEWSLNEFYSKGGTSTFADRVSGSLGIHASDVKIVSVYEGSLTVNYDIVAPAGKDASYLKNIAKKQTEQFATGKMDLGAPVLDVASVTASSTSTAPSNAPPVSIISGGMVSAPGFEPITITKTASGGTAAPRKRQVWKPDIKTIVSETTTYQNVTVTQTKELVKPPAEIVRVNAVDDKTASWIIIMVALVILGIIIVIACFRYIYF